MKQKINLILAAVLLGATATHAEPVIKYAGVSVGKTIGGNDTSNGQATGGVFGGTVVGNGHNRNALEVEAGFASVVYQTEHLFLLGGAEAKVLGLNGKTILMPSINMFVSPVGTPLTLKLSMAGSNTTGVAAGLALQTSLSHFCKSCSEDTILKVGYTNFQKKIDGVSGLVAIGFDSVF